MRRVMGLRRRTFWCLLNEVEVAISAPLWLMINSLRIRGPELFRPR
jgi:hypothetical protein